MGQLAYAEPPTDQPVRRQLVLTRIAGALGLLILLHRVALRVSREDDLTVLQHWRFWGLALALALASALALSGRLSSASAAPLVGVALPVAFLDSAVFLQWHALKAMVTTLAPSELWLLTSEWIVLLVLAVAALATAPDLRRLGQDWLAPLTLLVAAVFVGWQYQSWTLGTWHDEYPLEGVGYDLLTGAAVLVPLVWGLGLPQPKRAGLLLGWAVAQGLYWSGWFEPRIPQREFPWVLVTPLLLVLTVVAALRPAPDGPAPSA